VAFFVDRGPLPAVEEVQPGLWSMPQPMPGPLRYVLVYALEVGDGVLLVDAGWGDPENLVSLERGLQTFGATVADVRGVLFTHYHGDHYALAGRVREESGAWLALHEIEARLIEEGVLKNMRGETLDRWLDALGVSSDEREELLESTLRVGGTRAHVAPDRVLTDGSTVELDGWRLEALHTPGHSPGHLCYLCADRGVVFTGDCVLSMTTPNVSIFPGTVGSPLDDYIASLTRLLPLGDLLALPGHEERVPVAERATELLAHHDQQLRNTAELVANGHDTVRALAEHMDWAFPGETFTPIDRFAAMGEAYAHLVVLERRGELELVGTAPSRWRPSPT
jgi:glyoxylase-like metal-dependent hydrolase (beta-lactamase superfamily II)